MKNWCMMLLQLTVSSGALVFVIFAARWLLRKAGTPKKWIVVLWALLAIRLAVPVTVSLPFSLLPDFSGWLSEETVVESVDPVSMDSDRVQTPEGRNHADAPSGTEVLPDAPSEPQPAEAGNVLPADSGMKPKTETGEPKVVTSRPKPWIPGVYDILVAVYLTGTLGMLLYFAISYLRLSRRVRQSIPLSGETGVFLSDQIKTAFVLGFFRCKIYLPIHMPEVFMNDVLRHERSHISRKDPLWKLLGFLLLSLHWFNPLVWIAYFAFIHDLEYACDEKAVAESMEAEKKEYANALLFFSGAERSPFFCRVAFGEPNVKERIENLMASKKHYAVVSVLIMLLAVTLSACLFTTGGETGTSRGGSEGTANDSAGEEATPFSLSEIHSSPTYAGLFRLEKEEFERIYGKVGYRLSAYLGETEDAYCFLAIKESTGRSVVVYLSKGDASLQKELSFEFPQGVKTTGILYYGLYQEKPVIGVSWSDTVTERPVTEESQRIGLLNDDGSLTEWLHFVKMREPEIRILEPVVCDRLFYIEKPANNHGILKALNLQTMETEVIRTAFMPGEEDTVSFLLSPAVEKEPEGVFYTVVSGDRKPGQPDNKYDCDVIYELNYYRFSEQKSKPVLEAKNSFQYNDSGLKEGRLFTYSDDPFWEVAIGDPDELFVYGSASDLFQAIDLKNGTACILDQDGSYPNEDPFIGNQLLEVRKVGEAKYMIRTKWKILEYDSSAFSFNCYQIPSGNSENPYLELNMADDSGRYAIAVDRDAGTARLYDLYRSKRIMETSTDPEERFVNREENEREGKIDLLFDRRAELLAGILAASEDEQESIREEIAKIDEELEELGVEFAP